MPEEIYRCNNERVTGETCRVDRMSFYRMDDCSDCMDDD